MSLELDTEQLEMLIQALRDYENKHYADLDDYWQDTINTTISQLNDELNGLS